MLLGFFTLLAVLLCVDIFYGVIFITGKSDISKKLGIAHIKDVNIKK